MEKPRYGRTGLLADPQRDGTVVTRTRLLRRHAQGPAAASADKSTCKTDAENEAQSAKPTTVTRVALKWRPTPLTIPDRLLQQMARAEAQEEEGEAGEAETVEVPDLLPYLRVAALHRAAAAAGLSGATLTSVFEWCARREGATGGARRSDAGPPPPLPRLKALETRDGRAVGRHRLAARALTLVGKDRALCDVPAEHPSCSSQHAALQHAFALADEDPILEAARTAAAASAPDGESQRLQAVLAVARAALEAQEAAAAAAGRGALSLWEVQLQLVDLGSTNGTTLNGERVPPYEPAMLMDGDVISFGFSSRRFVLMREGDERK